YSLYGYATGYYDDITMAFLGMMVELDRWTRDRLVTEAREGDRPFNTWLLRLGWLTQHFETPKLEQSFEQTFGPDWEQAYWEANDQAPYDAWRETNGQPR
ncbi:MAG: hypothetical protein ABEN55_14055, partial [Bradymonadaceae bacterium]